MRSSNTVWLSVALLAIGAAAGWLAGGGRGEGAEAGPNFPGARESTGPPSAGRWSMSHLPTRARAMTEALRGAPAGKEQMRAAIELANTVPVDEIEEWLDGHYADTTNGWVDGVCWLILMSRLYEADPERCLGRCFRLGAEGTEEFMARWTRDDPKAVEAFVMSREKERWSGSAAELFLRELAGRDPVQTIELLSTFSEGKWGDGSYWTVLETLAMTNRDALIAAAEEWRPELREPALRYVTRGWMQDDFAGAIAWLSEDPRGQERFVAACGHGESIGPMLFERAAELPEGWLEAVIKSSSHWLMRENPDAWLRADAASLRISPKALEAVQVSAASWLGNGSGSRESAMALLAERPDLPEGVRRNLAARVVELWAKDDRAEAERWLASLGDEALQEAGQRVLSREDGYPPYAPVEPHDLIAYLVEEETLQYYVLRRSEFFTARELEEARAALRALPAEGRNRAADAILQHRDTIQSPQLIADAISHELATGDLIEETRMKETCDLAAEWGRIEPRAAARWVESLPPGQHREWAARNLVLSWARQSEVEVREWAEGLPDASEREAVMEVLGNE